MTKLNSSYLCKSLCMAWALRVFLGCQKNTTYSNLFSLPDLTLFILSLPAPKQRKRAVASEEKRWFSHDLSTSVRVQLLLT